MNAAAASPLRKQIRLQEGVRNLNVEDLLGSQAVASSPAREPSVVPGSPSVASDAAREDAAILDTVDDDPFQEEEDDDDFEQRTAPVNQSRRLATMQSTQPANRVLPKPRSPPAPSGTARTYVNPTQASTTSSVPPTASQMEDLRTLARLNRRAVAAKSEQRRRIPWSVRDEEILVELIRKYECSWSMIAEEGGFETSRDQQACRDKARNLKVVYLSTDQPLPALFDKVALSKKERDAVRNAGRNPSRCEADIDDDGQVINTIDPDL
ncbi:uncharacterized protein B0I36DRAFT_69106 [Microdochium trichocladiopsis]|uniref:Myb-like domain-containing protein n=1 Tax=Microdochium trichocladiopsis TaxID=1682393 RepID=A0A9P8YDV1_9PEZI|nr:uncharacterized protein B0I36DRAFT_69106 [Microdochium trichocladiopsis]KAH7037640.1 hypothetical protein B0I36DRAFT_69106 [Microdochium trichocladiopsis]